MASPPPTLTTLPTPSHLTLLFKHHRSTTLLSVLPTTPFTQITSLLHAALTSRSYPSIPSSPDNLELGVLADRKDPSRGWISLDTRIRQEEKGKGKAAKGARASVGGSGSVERDTPEGVGLGDGAWLAWRVRTGKKGESEDEEEEDAVIDIDDPGWDVVLPSLEEVEEVEDAMEP